MTPAYDKLYLDSAQENIAVMLDFAVNEMNYDLTEYYNLFITTGVAKMFGMGSPTYIAGHSGVELVYRVLEEKHIDYKRAKVNLPLNRSKEYWTGWAIAYYQWSSGKTFEAINKYVPIETVRNLYSPYHEMDIRQFVDKINEIYCSNKVDTNLKIARMRAGISQRELSELSNVPYRTIQEYEQGRKPINNAKVEYVLDMATVLGCSVSDIIE